MCDATHLCPPAARLHAARASRAARAPPPSASHASPSPSDPSSVDRVPAGRVCVGNFFNLDRNANAAAFD